MTTTASGLMIALLCGAAAACAASAGAARDRNGIADQPPTAVETVRDRRNDTVVLVRGSSLSQALAEDDVFRKARSHDHAAAMARRFIDAYRKFFRLEQPEAELRAHAVTGDELGYVHVRLHQIYGGLNVWDGEIIVHLDRDRQIYRVQGHYIPTPSGIDLRPRVTVDQAGQAAAQTLGKAACQWCEVELGIAATKPPRLAYRVVTRPSIAERWVITVDARDGTVIDKLSTIMPGTLQRKDAEPQR